MSERDVLAAQLPEELGLVVAGNAERGTALDHPHDKTKDIRRTRPPVNEIPEKDGPPAFRSRDGDLALRGVADADRVSKALKKRNKLVKTAVDIADDVEGSSFVPPVGP